VTFVEMICMSAISAALADAGHAQAKAEETAEFQEQLAERSPVRFVRALDSADFHELSVEQPVQESLAMDAARV